MGKEIGRCRTYFLLLGIWAEKTFWLLSSHRDAIAIMRKSTQLDIAGIGRFDLNEMEL